MPTGYTAKLMVKGQDFREFVLTCARGMGACVMQRDDPMSDPLKKQEPTDYHVKALAEARRVVAEIQSFTPEQRSTYGEALRAGAISNAAENRNVELQEEFRLQEIARLVKAWTPPTNDHCGLKDFMLEQLRISSHGDWMAKRVAECEAMSAESYVIEKISKASRNIEYHKAEQVKELERVNARNQWIDQLYRSLP